MLDCGDCAVKAGRAIATANRAIPEASDDFTVGTSDESESGRLPRNGIAAISWNLAVLAFLLLVGPKQVRRSGRIQLRQDGWGEVILGAGRVENNGRAAHALGSAVEHERVTRSLRLLIHDRADFGQNLFASQTLFLLEIAPRRAIELF